MSRMKTAEEWIKDNHFFNDEETPAALLAWDGALACQAECKPYQYNRAQLKGVLMFGYGTVMPSSMANDLADRVLDQLENNELVQQLIAALGDVQ